MQGQNFSQATENKKKNLRADHISEVIQEPLPFKPRILVEKIVLVKRKDGFTKTIPWTGNPGKIGRRAFE